MKHRTRSKPISHLKANTAQVIREVVVTRVPLIITQKGVASYDATQETMALLKILALGNRQIEAGQVMPVRDAIRRVRREVVKSG